MRPEWQHCESPVKLTRVTVGGRPVRQVRNADEKQAAYFRAELETARQALLDEVVKRRALIERPRDVGRPTRVMSAEAELRHIEWLMARLDRRFPADPVADSA